MARRRFIQSLAIIAAAVALIAPRAVSQTANPLPRVLQRTEPVLADPADVSSEDAIVTIVATIDTSGALAGPVEIVAFRAPETRVRMAAKDVLAMQALIDRVAAAPPTAQTPRAASYRIRAAFDALLQWRFEPDTTASRAAFGFNFARTAASGMETEPVRVGRDLPAPARARDVKPFYPLNAIAREVQGSVVVEVVVDGAGIPVSAFIARPLDALATAAVQAALQSRFTPDATYSRRLVTITSDFKTLDAPGSFLGGVPGAAPPPPPAPTAPVRVGGNIAQPAKVKDAAPVMPEVARQARVQGVVILEIIIGTDGKVQDAKILRSIPLLDQAALDCVRQWEYTPILLNGTPVSVIMTATVNFTLD